MPESLTRLYAHWVFTSVSPTHVADAEAYVRDQEAHRRKKAFQQKFREFLQRYDMPIDESFFRGTKRQRTVLVVDDEPDIREIVSRVLKELDDDMKIEEAADGYEAGIKIGSLAPDLVIMDLLMPRVDGLSLCRSIRENPETRTVKVLAITAVPEQDNVKKMYDAGADLCLIKPLQLEHFKLEVVRLLHEAERSAASA